MELKQIDTNGKVELFTIDNFLNEQECNLLISEIDKKAERSKVSGGETGFDISDYRTSYTANLINASEDINNIDIKICQAIGVDPSLGEAIQGQRYEIGQEFKRHTDFFDLGTTDYYIHTGALGQRTFTFMIYLNDVEEGGETFFENLNISFTPKQGTAVIWNNLNEDGTTNSNTLHTGTPVIKGTKYIITKWFRTGIPTLNNTTVNQNTETKNGKIIFKSAEELPKFSEKGFKVIDIPNDAWRLLQEVYTLLKPTAKPEPNLGDFIKSDKNHGADLMSLDNLPEFRNLIHEKLMSIHREWCGMDLELATFYGIRSYLDGAVLLSHKDRPSELHVSSIMLIDEKSNKPWPLDIKDHDGNWNKVVIKPGQMIMYESSLCEHGRLEPFDGEYYRNCFIHYKFKDYEYAP